MSGIQNFILRFLIVFVPVALGSYLVISFQTFSKVELVLLSVLSAGLPWLFYEVLQRLDHQEKTNKAMLGFCTSMETVFSRVSSLETSTQKIPNEIASELKMLQSIMQQISKEKEVVAEQQKEAVGASTTTSFSTVDLSLEEPFEETADILDFQSPSVVEEISEGDFKDPVTEDKTAPPLTADTLLEVVERALNSNNIEMLVQPIVSLPQRKARHFECFSRIKEADGSIYTPDTFLNLAEEGNIIRLVDNAMLFRCIQMARASVQKKFDVNFFCNVSARTLSDKFFFESLSEFLQSNKEIARHVIFEFHEDAIANHYDTLEPLLRSLKLFNCRFSIDQVTNLGLDVKRLKKLNFKYIKFHSDTLINVLKNDSGHKKVKEFKSKCDLLGMDVILSHIEDEKTLLELNDFNFDYGQGFLFGVPVLSKR